MSNAKISKLKNGITIITDKTEGTGTFSLGFFFNTGAICETKHEAGISHFIEHLMFKGTEKRTAKEISEYIDYEGGNMNAFTSREFTGYYIKMLSSKIDIAIEVFSDMLINSTFSQENIDKERNVIIEEIKMYEDIPEEVVHEKNIEFALRGIHSNSISGTEEGLKKISREDILKYLKEQYVKENLVISICGDINEEEVVASLQKAMDKLASKTVERKLDMSYEINKGENIIKKETNQVHLCFNTRGVAKTSEHKYPSALISNVLGGGMSSRLFQKIREERGLAYSVYTYSSRFDNCGLFTIYAGTTKNDYRDVIAIIEEEIKDIKNNGMTTVELEKAKNKLKSDLIFALESTNAKMMKAALSYLEEQKLYSIDDMITKIDAVTMDDIKKTADFMFDENYYSFTVLGDI